MPDKIIAELAKGPLDKLVISIRAYQGHTFVDLRMQFLGDDDQFHPTKKGITVSPQQWPEFLEALSHVQAHLPAEGSSPARQRSPRGTPKR